MAAGNSTSSAISAARARIAAAPAIRTSRSRLRRDTNVSTMVADGVDRPGALQGPMRRALAVFRFAALAYATAVVAWRYDRYEHPAAGWVIVAGMVAWTAF